MYAQPTDTDTHAVMAGAGGWVKVGRWGETGTSVIVSTIKIKENKVPTLTSCAKSYGMKFPFSYKNLQISPL